VAAQLEDVGLSATLVEGTPGRTNVITRIAGADPSRPALLLHGHLDVVPAQAADWQVDPFAGEIRDDFLWGRGAVDMKDMVAMILALGRDLARSGRRPPRDLVLAFLADEEAGGDHGAGWLVKHRPELFEGVGEAVSEVGGFSVDLTSKQGGSQRAYLLQTAEKGIAWVRLVAHGRAGHGSVVNDDNAVTRLAAAVTRIGSHRWPVAMTDAVGQLLAGLSEITGEPLPAEDFGAMYRAIGTAAVFVGATVRNTSNPTGLQAGYKHNVIPGQASALIDCRFVPGQEQALLDTLRELAGPQVEVEGSARIRRHGTTVAPRGDIGVDE
jgi:acetylornithine deacetylase/succinyl-diaminopimelate desuccinylase-like protein